MHYQAPDLLFVINDFSFLKSHRLSFIKFLSEKGLKIIICTDCTEASESEIKSLNKIGINIIDLKLSRSSIGILTNLYSLVQLYKIVLKYKPKKLSLISAKPIVLGGFLALIHSFETIYFSVTGLGYVFISQSFKAKFIRLIILAIYKLIFLNNSTFYVIKTIVYS